MGDHEAHLFIDSSFKSIGYDMDEEYCLVKQDQGQTGQTKRMTAYIPAYSGETGTQAPKPPRARKQQASRPDPSPLSCGGTFDIKIAFHLFSLHASASVPLSSGRDLKPPTRTT